MDTSDISDTNDTSDTSDTTATMATIDRANNRGLMCMRTSPAPSSGDHKGPPNHSSSFSLSSTATTLSRLTLHVQQCCKDCPRPYSTFSLFHRFFLLVLQWLWYLFT